MRTLKLGAGNKKADLASLLLSLVTMIVLAFASFVNHNLVFMFEGFVLISFVNLVYAYSHHYVMIYDDQFVISHILKRKVSIDVTQFSHLNSPLLKLPFSNDMVIHFKGGMHYRFMGGSHTLSQVNRVIREVSGPQP